MAVDMELLISTLLLDVQNSIANRYESENSPHIDTGKMIGSIARDGLLDSTSIGVGYKLTTNDHSWLSILYMRYGTPFCAPFLSDIDGLVEEWVEQNVDKYIDLAFG